VVWDILVDVERTPEWTPSMRSVHLEVGRVLHRGIRAHIKQPWLRRSTWTVDLFDPPRYFSWHSRSGPIETKAGHQLTDLGTATFATLTIRHSGPGAWLVGSLVRPLERRYVNWELQGLEARAQQAYA
jgi:Polyketide cyclase / dehydrase and lipid transport